MRLSTDRDIELRLAAAVNDLPEHWKDKIQRLRQSGQYDRRYLAYLANQLKNAPPEGEIDDYLSSRSGPAELPLDPYGYHRPSEIMHDWARHNWKRGGFDLTSRPLDSALSESRKWGGTFSEVEDDLGDGWKARRLRNPKDLKNHGSSLGVCVGRGFYHDQVAKGTNEIWIIVNPEGSTEVMIRCSVDSEGNKKVEEIRGHKNASPSPEAQQKADLWLSMHEAYPFDKNYDYEEDEEENEEEYRERRRRETVRADIMGDFPNIEPHLEQITPDVIPWIASTITEKHDELNPQTLETLVERFPEQIGRAAYGVKGLIFSLGDPRLAPFAAAKLVSSSLSGEEKLTVLGSIDPELRERIEGQMREKIAAGSDAGRWFANDAVILPDELKREMFAFAMENWKEWAEDEIRQSTRSGNAHNSRGLKAAEGFVDEMRLMPNPEELPGFAEFVELTKVSPKVSMFLLETSLKNSDIVSARDIVEGMERLKLDTQKYYGADFIKGHAVQMILSLDNVPPEALFGVIEDEIREEKWDHVGHIILAGKPELDPLFSRLFRQVTEGDNFGSKMMVENFLSSVIRSVSKWDERDLPESQRIENRPELLRLAHERDLDRYLPKNLRRASKTLLKLAQLLDDEGFHPIADRIENLVAGER